MLNQAFWRNGAWLLQLQLRSKFGIEVCYIKTCCALNKETFMDNFEALAASVEKEADVDVSSKSELVYFATEAQTPRVQLQSKHRERLPRRQTLSYTNKVLFGPLLETSAEKRRRIKAEEGEDGSTQRTKKRKKGKKKEPAVPVQPLIQKPENAHFLGLFPGSEPKYVDKVQVCKVEIQPQNHEMGGFSYPRTVMPKSKILIFKKSSKYDLKFDKSLLKDIPSVHKLYVASWNKEKEVSVSSCIDEDPPNELDVSCWNHEKEVNVSSKEVNVSSCTNEDTPDEGSQADEGDVLSGNIFENNVSKYNSIGDTIGCSSSDLKSDPVACSSSGLEVENDQGVRCLESNRESSSDLKGDTIAYSSPDLEGENNQEIQDLKSNRETSSLLYVDNTKFSSAPSVIDSEVMANFPLEQTDLPNIQCETPMNAGDTIDNILTIRMFDGGYQRLPSVSKILEATMSEANRRVLERWKAKMIRELGEEGFEEYRKGLFDKGKLLHDCIQSELTGVSSGVENLPTLQGVWTSISHVLPSITNVSVLESRLVHPYLYYQGAVDCIATYKGMPVLIDWKTSTKPKLTLKSMYDNPLQVVAYLGALNYDSNYQLPHKVQSAIIVVAYDSGLPAHVHIIDKEKCQAYWRQWCARLVQFWRQLQVKEFT